MTDQPPNYPPPGGYGYPPPQPYQPYPPNQGGYGYPPSGPGTNGMATASLVCSLVGWLCGIGLVLGVIFGFIALSQIKRTGQPGRGMAIAGIIIGFAPIVIGLLIFLVAFVFGVFGQYHP